MNIQQTLHDTFHFEQFLPGQSEVIHRLINTKSVLAVFPTGQGKSLCYQLTAQHLQGMTLVVSPLMALMKDQVDALRTKGINGARLDSSLSHEEYSGVVDGITAGSLKLLYIAPERLANERFLATLSQVDISMIVIDEAHCISEWGHNFRPDYLALAGFADSLAIPLRLCLTATATPEVVKDILKSFVIEKENYIKTGFYRPNLALRFSPSDKPFETLVERLEQRQAGATIVYVTLQDTAEKVAGKLRGKGYAARPYHAGLKSEEREGVQEWFMASDRAIVVATIAFGMGIDKSDIRYVYHYNLPKSLENYSQEIGRAGRDGKRAVCEVLGSSRDLTVLENFSYGDTPDDTSVQQITEMLLNQPDKFDISFYELSRQYDMRPLVVKTLLTYLELEKLIVSTGPFYTSYQFVPHRSSAEIFSRFDQERVTFLRGMFSCAQKAKKWFHLDIDEVMATVAAPRRRIVAALNYLEEKGDIELKVGGVRRGYRLLRRPGNDKTQALTTRLQEKFKIREEQDIKRLADVVGMIGNRGCQTGFLLSYFGEDLAGNCGHCEHCLSGNGKQKEIICHHDTRKFEVSPEALKTIETVLSEKHPPLSTSRQQARFFCGLRSPQVSRAGLPKRRGFGILANQPFCKVKEWIDGR